MKIYKRTPAYRRSKFIGAFSLIEIVIALGIVSFCVIPLLGLMTSGLQASKNSQQDTVLALAAKYILSDLRGQTFSSLNVGATTNYLFDYQGDPLSSNSPPSQHAYYTAAVTITANPLAAVTSWNTNASPNLLGVKITFDWPGQTNGNPHATVFNTSLAGY